MCEPDVVLIGETVAALAAGRAGPRRRAGALSLSVVGPESTVAIGLARLGHHPAWIGRIGADEMGLLVQGTLRGEGVTTHVVVDAEAPTGLILREQRTADRHRIHHYRRGSAGSRLAPRDIPAGLVESGRILHVGAVTPALSASASDAVDAAVCRARVAGVTVSFDAEYSAQLWSAVAFVDYVTARLPSIDLMFTTLDDACLLLGASAGTSPLEAALALAERGPRAVVVTPGSGAASYSFVAGYLSGMLSGSEESSVFCNARGSCGSPSSVGKNAGPPRGAPKS